MKKNKKWIILISIVTVLWCAFMGYRKINRQQDTVEHKQRETNRLIEIAKQSPRAGLVQMARAINDYYDKHHQYPDKLMDLYPTYLANKAFIDEIDWFYQPSEDNFQLSKTIVKGTKRMVASIDKGLRPQGEKAIMVATPTPIPKTNEIEKPDVNILERYEPTSQEKLDLAREKFLEMLRERELKVASVSVLKKDEEKIISTIEPELISYKEPEVGSGVEFDLSNKYLVWKGKNGVLGFSNVQYPDTDRLTFCAVGRWYDVKIPKKKSLETIDSEIETVKSKHRLGMIASGFDRKCLVWKDKQGTLGFGNVEYPERDPVSIYQTDGWVSIERAAISTETGTYKEQGRQEEKSDQTIVSGLSKQYLVWKEKDGTLGFGNVEYPERDPVSIYQTDGWVSIERAAISTETGTYKEQGRQEEKSDQAIVSELSKQYLVWKEKDGTLGFGNVEYPEMSHTSHIHINGSWEPVTN